MVMNSFRRFLSWQAAAWIGVCLGLVFSQSAQAQSSTSFQAQPITGNPALPNKIIASPTPQVPRAYFPLVLARSGGGIFGLVTQDGIPVGNVTLNLRKIDSSSTITVGAAVTDSSGFYQFLNADSLASSQGYQVIYYYPYGTNDTVSGRLSYWKTKMISVYAQGENVNIGNFDISDVALISPENYTSEKLPVTFTWVKRSHSTTDSYSLEIVDYDGNTGVYTEKFTSPEQGYSDHFEYQLSDWDAGMVYEHNYLWYVTITAPDGATGISRLVRQITFNSNP